MRATEDEKNCRRRAEVGREVHLLVETRAGKTRHEQAAEGAARDVARCEEHARREFCLRPFFLAPYLVNEVPSYSTDEDRSRCRKRQVDADREGKWRDAAHPHEYRNEDADKYEPPRQLPREDTVDDQVHEPRLGSVELGYRLFQVCHAARGVDEVASVGERNPVFADLPLGYGHPVIILQVGPFCGARPSTVIELRDAMLA